MGIIEAILPRETDIARWKGGARGQKQTLAANVDLVLVVQALDGEAVSVDRIVRSAVISKDCGAACAVVLTKSDVAGPELWRKRFLYYRSSWLYSKDCCNSFKA